MFDVHFHGALDKMNMVLTAPNQKRFPASLCVTWNMRLNENGLTKGVSAPWGASQ